MKQLLLAAALFAAIPGWSADGTEVFTCAADRTLALVYDAATQKWDGRMFPDNGQRWIVREVTKAESSVMGLPENAFVVQLDGRAQIELVCRDGFTLNGDLSCERPRVSTFKLSNATLRYLFVRHDGYWTRFGRQPGEEAPVAMEIGRCKAL